jgi:hypothetical protein
MVVAGIGYVIRRIPIFQIQRYVPQPPGRLGGIFRLSLRQIMTTLDFYVALMASVSGVLYRLVNSHADPTAFPIVAVIVALALSTYAQRMFGLDGVAGETRYRLLPLRGWQLLLAKDAAYLGVLLVLVLPLGVLPGLAFGLMALTVGRYASLTSSGMQLRWRFVGGDILVGIAQVAIGVAVSFGCLRFGVVMFAGAVAVYVASLVAGGRLWERNPGRISAAAKRARRRRLAKGW